MPKFPKQQMVNKVWEPAQVLLDSLGFKRATPELEELIFKFETHKDIHDILFDLNTHPRSGEFNTLVSHGVPSIRKHAKGRKIWWIGDPDSEWMNILFLYGNKKELQDRLETEINKQIAKQEADKKSKIWEGEAFTMCSQPRY